jgi:acetyltransferase
VNKNPTIKMIKAYRTRGMHEIGEVDSKTILEAYNFDLPEGNLATSVEEAMSFGNQLGYPLAMKISSPDILHKSDVGGIRVGLDGPGEVADAYELMMLRVGRRRPDAEVRGVLLEKMVVGGQEVILGVKRDPQFGPMIMFGLGGIFVEVLKDVTFGLAPLTEGEIRSMIEGTRSYGLLRGALGKAPRDVEAIIENIQRLSQLVVDFPEIEEVDINPLMVGHEGDGALVVDGRIVISK